MINFIEFEYLRSLNEGEKSSVVRAFAEDVCIFLDLCSRLEHDPDVP